MMPSNICVLLALLSSVLYLYATRILWQRFKISSPDAAFNRTRLLIIVLIAMLAHFGSFANHVFENGVMIFGFGITVSMVLWLAVITLLVTNINKSTENLGVFIFPVAAASTFIPLLDATQNKLPMELGSHILISISAYSIMSLATVQAILYSKQEKRFQKRQLSTIFKNLPPLQIMERILIQLVIIGFVLLSFALLSGIFFMEDIFAQHLVHKTFFAILAWITYGVLLFGHFKFGWRGQRAAAYTIWAYVLLVLSYIGTEITLNYFI